ncbi:MAG: ribosome hibernation-promoting factor, HPF/YfiA family [Saprospiraceae bacterium]
MLNIRVNAQHFTADQKLLDFIQKKMAKLERYFKREVDVEVSLKLQDTGSRIHDKITEIRLNSHSGWVVDRKIANTFEDAINASIDTLRRQLVEKKDRLQHRGKRASDN